MRQCLDEGMLQSYFDGELSTSMAENATLHIASCATCSSAARELEQENALLSEAFAFELEESVPTERLRRKVDAAITGIQVARPIVARPSAVSNFLSSLSSLFSFNPQRALGYAALLVVLAFAVIFGLAKLRSSVPNPQQASNQPVTISPVVSPVNVNPTPINNPGAPSDVVATATQTRSSKIDKSVGSPNRAPRATAVKFVPKNEPIRLLPGERSYLQTIARLDTTINEGKKNMRPALQVEYERNLAVVDRAIAATRNAAKNNPSNPDAADFMFAAYQSKVDLLNTIADARVYNRTH